MERPALLKQKTLWGGDVETISALNDERARILIVRLITSTLMKSVVQDKAVWRWTIASLERRTSV